MKIKVLAVLIRFQGGGAETSVATTANALSGLGVTVERWACDEARPGEESHPDRVLSRGGKGPLSVLGAARTLRRVILSSKPDVVHIHCERPEFVTALALLSLSRANRPPIVVTEHTRSPWSSQHQIGTRVRAVLRRFDAIFISCFPILPDTIYDDYIPNPIAVSAAPRRPSPTLKRILVVGRLIATKNVDLVLRSVISSDLRLPVLVIGDGPERPRLEEISVDSPQIEFAGYQADPWALADSGDLIVSASSLEGDPLSVSEAILQGLPVLVSDIDAHRELVPEANTFTDQDGLVSTLLALQDGRDLTELRINNIDSRKSERAPHTIALRWLEKYQAIAKR